MLEACVSAFNHRDYGNRTVQGQNLAYHQRKPYEKPQAKSTARKVASAEVDHSGSATRTAARIAARTVVTRTAAGTAATGMATTGDNGDTKRHLAIKRHWSTKCHRVTKYGAAKNQAAKIFATKNKASGGAIMRDSGV